MHTTGKVIYLGSIPPKNPDGLFRVKLFDLDELGEFEVLFPAALEANPGEQLFFDGQMTIKRGKYGVYVQAVGSFARKNGKGGE